MKQLFFFSAAVALATSISFAQPPSLPGAGNCLSFNGTSDYVEIPTYANLNFAAPATISFWFKSSVDVENNVFGLGKTTPGTGGGFGIVVGGNPTGTLTNELITILRDSNNRYGYVSSTRTEVIDNRWHHIAVVCNGTQTFIYLDGISKPITVGSAADCSNDGKYGGQTNITSASIGQVTWNGIKTEFTNGQIDEVRIWNRALTQTEIRDNLCQKLIGNETGLVGYWRFDETSGTTAYDSQTNVAPNNGTLK